MDRAEYLNGVNEFMYQGEVFGEALLNAYVELEEDPDRLFKWATLLQLETETKARLRPFMVRLGLSVAQADMRAAIAGYVSAFTSKSWRQHMEEVATLTAFYIEKFKELGNTSSDSERDVTHSMVVHETAINTFAKLELAGDAAGSLNDVAALLRYPLPRR